MTLEHAKNHPEVKFGKTGVLIINLGTPDSTGWWDIRKYFKEFFAYNINLNSPPGFNKL